MPPKDPELERLKKEAEPYILAVCWEEALRRIAEAEKGERVKDRRQVVAQLRAMLRTKRQTVMHSASEANESGESSRELHTLLTDRIARHMKGEKIDVVEEGA